MKHLIMGTAGHVDHGKTTLIKALSGIDCDTHKQEKERGITINLGFAHLTLSNGDTVSIVDVPGHKDFINTMVAGACGIDFVLMVIAADEGIMPQTEEHFRIMDILGISYGLIALTKTDSVDQELAELAGEEIIEFTKGTFLENAPVIPVSSKTGEGIDKLKTEIEKSVGKIKQRSTGDIFRLFIDRIFTIKGFGTVLTGSVISGVVNSSDEVYLLPSDKKLRIKKLQRHGKDIDKVIAGDRASLNVSGMKYRDYKRGMVLCDKFTKSTEMFDAKLKLFKGCGKISIWSYAIFLLGTYEAKARIHLIDRETASGEDEPVVQVHLPKPCIVCTGDRFIIRNTSNEITMGGGIVIDSAPLFHRRRPEKLINNLKLLADGKLQDLISIELNKLKKVASSYEVAVKLNVAHKDVLDALNTGLIEGINIYSIGNEKYLLTSDIEEFYKRKIMKDIKSYHKKNTLLKMGRTTKELAKVIRLNEIPNSEKIIKVILEKMASENQIRKEGNTWVDFIHKVEILSEMEKKINDIEEFFKNYGLKVAPSTEIKNFAQKNNIDEKNFNQLMKYLIAQNRIFVIDGDFIHKDVAAGLRMKLLKALMEHPEGLTVAGFRDLFTDNRKICLRLYALYDMEGITERKGDVRVITQKGIDMLKETE